MEKSDEDEEPTAPGGGRVVIGGVELVDALTPATAADVYAALGRRWSGIVGPIESVRPLELLLAQWAFETGRGKSMHCWNLGNAKSVAGDGRDYTHFTCDEVFSLDYATKFVAASGGLASFEWKTATQAGVLIRPPHPACRFRAFRSLDEGVADWLDLERNHFKSAWSALLTGDVALFAHTLKAEGYYTAPESVYAAGLTRIAKEFAALSPDGKHFDLESPYGLQGALTKLGFYAGQIDGILGKMSRAAIVAVQRGAVLEQTGIADAATRAAIAAALVGLPPAAAPVA